VIPVSAARFTPRDEGNCAGSPSQEMIAMFMEKNYDQTAKVGGTSIIMFFY
jgi:hypothetical protein